MASIVFMKQHLIFMLILVTALQSIAKMTQNQNDLSKSQNSSSFTSFEKDSSSKPQSSLIYQHVVQTQIQKSELPFKKISKLFQSSKHSWQDIQKNYTYSNFKQCYGYYFLLAKHGDYAQIWLRYKNQDYFYPYTIVANGTVSNFQCVFSGLSLLIPQIQTKNSQQQSIIKTQLISSITLTKHIQFTKSPQNYFVRGYCHQFICQNKQKQRIQYTQICFDIMTTPKSVNIEKRYFQVKDYKVNQTSINSRQLQIFQNQQDKKFFYAEINMNYVVSAQFKSTQASDKIGTVSFFCYNSYTAEAYHSDSTTDEGNPILFKYEIQFRETSNFWYKLHNQEHNLMFLYWFNNTGLNQPSTDVLDVLQLPTFKLKKRIIIKNVPALFKKRQLSVRLDGKYVATFNGKQLIVINMDFQIVQSVKFPEGGQSNIKFTQFQWADIQNKLYFFHLGRYEGQYSQYKFYDASYEVIPSYIKQQSFTLMNSSQKQKQKYVFSLFQQDINSYKYDTFIVRLISCNKNLIMLIKFNSKYQIWIAQEDQSRNSQLAKQNFQKKIKKHRIFSEIQKQFSISDLQCINYNQLNQNITKGKGVPEILTSTTKILLTGMTIKTNPYQKPIIKNVLFSIDSQTLQLKKDLQIPLHLERLVFSYGLFFQTQLQQFQSQSNKKLNSAQKLSYYQSLTYNQIYIEGQMGTVERTIFQKVSSQTQKDSSQYELGQQPVQTKLQRYKGSSGQQNVKMNSHYLVTVSYYSTTHFLCFNSSTFKIYNKSQDQIKNNNKTTFYNSDQGAYHSSSIINEFQIPRYFYSLIYDFQLHNQFPQLMFVYWYNSSKTNQPQNDIIQIVELPYFRSIKKIIVQNVPLEFKRILSIRDDGKYFLTFNSKQLLIFMITSTPDNKNSQFQFKLIKAIKFQFKPISPNIQTLRIFKQIIWSNTQNKVYIFSGQKQFTQVYIQVNFSPQPQNTFNNQPQNNTFQQQSSIKQQQNKIQQRNQQENKRKKQESSSSSSTSQISEQQKIQQQQQQKQKQKYQWPQTQQQSLREAVLKQLKQLQLQNILKQSQLQKKQLQLQKRQKQVQNDMKNLSQLQEKLNLLQKQLQKVVVQNKNQQKQNSQSQSQSQSSLKILLKQKQTQLQTLKQTIQKQQQTIAQQNLILTIQLQNAAKAKSTIQSDKNNKTLNSNYDKNKNNASDNNANINVNVNEGSRSRSSNNNKSNADSDSDFLSENSNMQRIIVVVVVFLMGIFIVFLLCKLRLIKQKLIKQRLQRYVGQRQRSQNNSEQFSQIHSQKLEGSSSSSDF